jgi:low temperature requirement protein LtrA
MSEPAAEERHATWLELFFDLVIVAAVAQLAHLLHEPDGQRLLIFAILYYAMWSVWTGFTLYANVAATRIRLITMLGAMFGIAVMAASVLQVVEHDRPQRFIIAYVACRMLAIASWKKSGEVMTEWPGVHQAVGLIPWVASLGFEAPVRYWLWLAGVLFDLGFTVLASRHPDRLLEEERREHERDQQRWAARLARRFSADVRPPALAEPRAVHADRPHLGERLGLFVIIVLGEAVAQLINEAAGVELWSYEIWLLVLTGFGLLVALWWLTLQYGSAAAPVSGAWTRALRLTMPVHYLTTAAIVAIAAGLGGLAGEAEHADAAVRWVLCGGAALYFLVAGPLGISGAALRWTLGWALPPAVAAILLGVFGGHLPVWVLVAALLGLALWQVSYRRLSPTRT